MTRRDAEAYMQRLAAATTADSAAAPGAAGNSNNNNETMCVLRRLRLQMSRFSRSASL